MENGTLKIDMAYVGIACTTLLIRTSLPALGCLNIFQSCQTQALSALEPSFFLVILTFLEGAIQEENNIICEHKDKQIRRQGVSLPQASGWTEKRGRSYVSSYEGVEQVEGKKGIDKLCTSRDICTN